jgi:hypothetical protein
MKNKKPKTSKEVLLTLVRKHQSKGIAPYITTKSTSYKIFRWTFFALVIICTVINLFYIISKSGNMAANIANMGEIQPHQELEIARLYTSLNIMVVASFGIVLSEIFIWFKLPLLQLISCIASSLTICLRIAVETTDTTSNALARNHIIPLAILCFFCIVSSALYLNQLKKDKKECDKLGTFIYNEYGIVAKDIPEDEWDEVLAVYNQKKDNKKKTVPVD